MTSHIKRELTDHTCNRRTGCTKVSWVCDHCYAEQWTKRSGHPELREGARRCTKTTNWKQAIKWDRVAAAAGVRRCVFPSLCDVFDDQTPERQRYDFRHRIAPTANLDRLLLKKRPQNIAGMLPEPDTGAKPGGAGWPNVWLGISAGNQEAADRNIAILLATPARVQFGPQSRYLGRLI
jgi:protein gp37